MAEVRLPRARWIGLAALVFALLAACGGPAAAEVIVAVAGPASGTGADRTAEIKAAAAHAVSRLNAGGGIGGEAARNVTDDDGCTSAGGEAAARRIVALNPSLVLGHPCAAAAVAAAKVYAAAGIVFIATSTRHPALTKRRAGPTIFRLDGRDDRQGTFAGATLARLYPGARAALVSDRTAYARHIVTDARAALLAATAPEPALFTLVAGDKDYGRLVGAIARSGAAVVLFAGFPLEAATVLRQLRAGGSEAAFIASDASATREFVDAAGASGRAARFVVRDEPGGASDGSLPDSATQAGRPASPLTRRTMAAVELWAKAVARASPAASGIAVAAALQGMGGDPAPDAAPRSPTLGFDASGDAKLASFRLIDMTGLQHLLDGQP